MRFAEALDMSLGTVKRDRRIAEAWLRRELGPAVRELAGRSS
jgi:hypothetical protein